MEVPSSEKPEPVRGMDIKGKNVVLNEVDLEDNYNMFGIEDSSEDIDADVNENNSKYYACGSMPLPTNLVNLPEDDIKKMKFQTWEEAHAFYLQYSRQAGFGIRVRDLRRGKSDQITMRRWVCGKEGQRNEKWLQLEGRKRRSKAETRENCLAEFRVKFDPPTNLWTVTNFVPDHSHELVKPEHIKFLKSHKLMSDSDKAQYKAMHMVGVKSSQVYDILASQRGGYKNLSFSPKDLHNWRSKIRTEERLDGDAQKALGYFEAKKVDDPAFIFRYKLNENNELGSLFWADSTSRADYACFGDLLAFDATYKRNVYNKPLVMLAGVNHHHKTIVFGCALLEQETTFWYNWLLQTFIMSMGDQKPFAVITDGDLAMRAAIREVLPEATHRLCGWHLERNASNQSTDSHFLKDFSRCLFDRMEIEEFEVVWSAFIRNHNLQDNAWANKMYGDRKMWAEAYLKDKFFAGIRTTSRCEGLNSFMNRYLNKTLMLFEFVVQFDIALSKLRENEAKDEYFSTYSTPVCNHTMRDIELHGAEVYTGASFHKFQKELENENNYILAGNPKFEGNIVTYKLCRYLHSKRMRTVVVNRQEKTFKCQCMLLQSCGLPCRHTLNAMKQENMKAIPQSCIVKRWTKSAKSVTSESLPPHGVSDEVARMVRYGALSALCNKMNYLAANSLQWYDHVSNQIMRLTRDLESLSTTTVPQFSTEAFHNVRDPQIGRSKGIPVGNKQKNNVPRKCGACRQAGHNKNKCPNAGTRVTTNVASNDISFDSLTPPTGYYGCADEDHTLVSRHVSVQDRVHPSSSSQDYNAESSSPYQKLPSFSLGSGMMSDQLGRWIGP